MGMSDSNQSINECLCGNLRIVIFGCETREDDKKYTVYKICLNDSDKVWNVYRRFREFNDLYEEFKRNFSQMQVKLPRKKLFGNLNPNFIEQRRSALDVFVKQILNNSELLHNPKIRSFFSLEKCNRALFERDRLSPAVSNGSSGISITSDSSQDDDKENKRSQSSEVLPLGPSERHHIKPSDFEFFNVIGKGTFGKVFLAKHKTEGGLYAVKVLQKEYVKKRNEIKHIMAERNVLVENIHHPFLVGLHYSFQTKDKLYFVLDYVNGGELYFHIQREKSFEEPRARFYAAEIASALGYLHSKNIIYRDLKPENLLLDAEGHIVLTDFGLCKEGIRASETTGTFCGTAEYLAPEVLLKKPYDRTVDWWCLGAVLYEMLFGLPPFYNRDHKTMYEDILYKPLRMRNTISEPAKELIAGLLQKDNTKRLGALHDLDEIRHHAFFMPIDFIALEAKKITPPFNPGVASQLDLRNIDKDFLNQSISNSISSPLSVSSIHLRDLDFDGFSYVPPLFD